MAVSPFQMGSFASVTRSGLLYDIGSNYAVLPLLISVTGGSHSGAEARSHKDLSRHRGYQELTQRAGRAARNRRSLIHRVHTEEPRAEKTIDKGIVHSSMGNALVQERANLLAYNRG